MAIALNKKEDKCFLKNNKRQVLKTNHHFILTLHLIAFNSIEILRNDNEI